MILPKFPAKPTQPETADAPGCVSQPRDRRSNPRAGAYFDSLQGLPISSRGDGSNRSNRGGTDAYAGDVEG
jgi:hypothetical protein